MAKWTVFDDEPYPGPEAANLLDIPVGLKTEWVERKLKLWTKLELLALPYGQFLKMGPLVRVIQRDPFKEYYVEDEMNLIGGELEIQDGSSGHINVQFQRLT